MSKTLLVIPTYNEADNIGELLQAIGRLNLNLDILIVDDASPDKTAEIVENIMRRSQGLFILRRQGKNGLGSAYISGFLWGLERGYDYFIEMDADFSHHPEYLKNHLELQEKYDFVIGSRYIPGGEVPDWKFIRRLISSVGNLYCKILLGNQINDWTGGFNQWSRKVLQSINLETLSSEGYAFQIEMKYRALQRGFLFVEFPIIFTDRRVGQSKMSKKIIIEALVNVPKLRKYAKQNSVK